MQLQSLYPEKIKFDEAAYKNGHHFSHYLYVINEIIPLSESKEGVKVIKAYVSELETLYNPTRYEQHQSIEEFRDAFRKLERGAYCLIEGIKKEMEKTLISEKESEELSVW